METWKVGGGMEKSIDNSWVWGILYGRLPNQLKENAL
jgi:hypothetical protein